MSEQPTEPPKPKQRPTTITMAAVFMFVLAAFNMVAGLVWVTGANRVAGAESVVRVVGVMDFVIGAVQIYAGMKIWALEEAGRSMGVIISAIGIGLGVLALLRGGFGLILGLALNIYIFTILVREREPFS